MDWRLRYPKQKLETNYSDVTTYLMAQIEAICAIPRHMYGDTNSIALSPEQFEQLRNNSDFN